MEGKFEEIDVNLIKTGRSQSRNRKVEKDLDVLVESIRKLGLLEPLTVYKNQKEDGYTLMAGQRRFLALKKIGYDKAPCVIRDMPVDATEEKAISYVENVIREKMDNKDIIDSCVLFFKKYKTLKAVAEELGIPLNKARRYIKYDRVPENVKKQVDTKNITMKVAVRAADALTWDGGSVEADHKVEELAEEMQKLSDYQQRYVVKVGQADPSKPVSSIIEKARKKAGKKISIIVLEDDYLRINNFKEKEEKDSIEDATYDLTKEGLDSIGY